MIYSSFFSRQIGYLAMSRRRHSSRLQRIKFYFADLFYRRKYFFCWSLLLIFLFISTVICISKSKISDNDCGIFGHGSFLNIDHDESDGNDRVYARHPVFVAYPNQTGIVEKHGQWRIVNHEDDKAYTNYNETFCNRVMVV